MEEVLTPADGEEEVAVERVLEVREEQRACAAVGGEEEDPADEGEGEREGVGEGQMREAEDDRADECLQGDGEE